MEKTVKTLSWVEELRVAEAQTPGHKASRGPGDTIVLTPIPEFIAQQRAERLALGIGRDVELALALDESVA